MLQTKKRTAHAFTLVELLIVIVVIGILVGLTTFGYGAWQKSTRIAQVKSDLTMAATAMQSSRNTSDTGYPSDIPNSIQASEGVQLSYYSGTSSTFCIDAISTVDSSIVFYIDEKLVGTTPVSGTCAGRSASGSAPAAPGAPTLTLQVSTTAQVSVSWSAVSGATSYTAQCASSPSFITGLITQTTASTSSNFNGLVPGDAYCRVLATNASGSSAYSASTKKVVAPNTGIKGWWAMNGGATDSSGSSYNGTVNGATLTTDKAGQANKAYSFNGSSYISIPTGAAITGNNPYTISIWFKISSMSSSYGMIGWGTWGSIGTVNALRINGTGTSSTHGIRHYWWGPDLDISKPTLGDSVWHNVTAMHDGSTRSLYIDGVKLGSDTSSAHSAVASDMNIGRTNTSEYFVGSLDDARVYSRAISDGEARAIYAAGPY